MELQTQLNISAPRDVVWRIVSDVESWVDTISAIQSVEVLEHPDQGLVGLKWRETRTMFGKSAVETMWVTDSVDGESYQTRAESHGAVYISRIYLTDEGDDTVVHMDFGADPVTLGARIIPSYSLRGEG